MTSRLNQEQYDILKRCSDKQNMSEWNSYRAEHPETPIHLEYADLRRTILEGAQLGACNLEGAQFEGANLLAADLRGADLRKADLRSANLWGVTLSEANLERACLISADLENADLRNANLEQAKLRRTNLDGAIVEDTELRKANIEGDNLEGKNLVGAIAQSTVEDSLPGTEVDPEVIIYFAEDISYSNFTSLIKCMESLGLILGASAPHLNKINFNPGLKKYSAWDRGELDNMISITVPKILSEILPEIFPVRMTSGQTECDRSGTEPETDLNNSESHNGIQSFLADAGFSEIEQQIAFKNLRLHNIEEGSLMKDIGAITNLVECRRIIFFEA